MIKTVLNRIKSDYFLKNRIKDYERIIHLAVEKNYKIITHSAFYKLVKENALGDDKYMLIRHDIDSDPLYCREWLRVEKKFDVKTSYYFRLCTVNIPVMQEIHNYGADCGYHFEEIADFAKEKNMTDPQKVMESLPEIQNLFKENFLKLENRCGFKIKDIASHGDFANRKLGINNYKLLTEELMRSLGIEFETYQKEFLDNYSINISDCGYPKLYKGDISPQMAIEEEMKVIHLLIHPRHWRSSWKYNTLENKRRFVEGLRFK